MAFAKFMSTPLGRGFRVVFGLVLMFLGWNIGGAGGTALGIFALLPLVTGVMNICVLGPLLGAPLRGKDVLEASQGGAK